jgi:ornithine cyclodeaminase/alanine dehydrogenase-like protein (mu-crystallin family)
VMDGARITAARTAAVTGAAVRALKPVVSHAPDEARIAILGAGVQARSHIPVLATVLGPIRLRVFDRHPERAGALVDFARQHDDVAGAELTRTAAEAVDEADIVVSVATLGATTEDIDASWYRPSLAVAVDFDTYVRGWVASMAPLLVVDDRAQFLAYRAAGYFGGYPDPTLTIGDLFRGNAKETAERAWIADGDHEGPIVVAHLGVGTADILFANEVLRTAEERGIGSILPR